MERWNKGMMGLGGIDFLYPIFQHSIIPSFHVRGS
jgi:hypothetical protein